MAKPGDNRIIIAALIGAAAAVLAATITATRGQFFNHRTVTGRVLSARTDARIAHAKVSLDGEGVPPILFTDSEGMFSFRWPNAVAMVRVTIEAPDFPLDEHRVMASEKILFGSRCAAWWKRMMAVS
jgi:hypothetical protein